MFTGIITHQVVIIDINGGTFTMQKPSQIDMHIGQSIAHDGACMSITQVTDETYSFFAMEESFIKTNFGTKKRGDTFNLETCIQANSMLDGHVVSGHIDTTGTVTATQIGEDGSKQLTISYNPQRDMYIIPKGSITINGVSLTVVDVAVGQCTVWLIPLTQEITNIGTVSVGDRLNIEYDMFGKYIVNYLQRVGHTG